MKNVYLGYILIVRKIDDVADISKATKTADNNSAFIAEYFLQTVRGVGKNGVGTFNRIWKSFGIAKQALKFANKIANSAWNYANKIYFNESMVHPGKAVVSIPTGAAISSIWTPLMKGVFG